MMIIPTEKIHVEIIPEILQMPMYCLESNGYIPLTFFTELGASEQDIKAILGSERFDNLNAFKIEMQKPTIAIPHESIGLLITQLAILPQFKVQKDT